MKTLTQPRLDKPKPVPRIAVDIEDVIRRLIRIIRAPGQRLAECLK